MSPLFRYRRLLTALCNGIYAYMFFVPPALSARVTRLFAVARARAAYLLAARM